MSKKKSKGRVVTVALAQTLQKADIDFNLAQITGATAQAAKAGARLVCFSECALTGYGPTYYKSPEEFEAKPILDGVSAVRALARQHKIAITIGMHLPAQKGGWTNSLLQFNAQGRRIAQYDKAHLYGCGPDYYLYGDKPPKTVSVAGIKVGLQICFDIRFPEPFRELAINGAETIIVPSYIHGKDDMWKGPVIEGHVRSRAAENGRFVFFVNAAGRTQNVPSMIANPRGEIIAKARKFAAQVITTEMDLASVNSTILDCRRTDLYDAPGRKV
jgi:predicted amidohydrolase